MGSHEGHTAPFKTKVAKFSLRQLGGGLSPQERHLLPTLLRPLPGLAPVLPCRRKGMDLGEKAHIGKATARGNALEQGRTCIQLGHAGSPQQGPQEMQPHLSSIHTSAKKSPSSFQGIQVFRNKTAPERTRLALRQANKRKKPSLPHPRAAPTPSITCPVQVSACSCAALRLTCSACHSCILGEI